MFSFTESLKYFTVLFQMRTNYLKYLRAVLLYRLSRKVEFPKAILKLQGARFLTRENSMDIAHLSNLYESKTTKLLLNSRPKTFIDVGTHIGRFSILLANRGAKVISIEPSKDNFKQLNKNIRLNNLQNKIIALNIGCSDKNENKTLYFVPHNEGLSSIEKKKEQKQRLLK